LDFLDSTSESHLAVLYPTQPAFPNGLDAIMGYIKQAGRIPCEVKRVAIDGDLAFVHVRYLDWGGKETAGVDIFRFDADILVDWVHGKSRMATVVKPIEADPHRTL
jgi:predicted SnoaL-like aldol condensation-catalyzing enzyme